MGIKKSRGSKKGKEFELREAKEWRGDMEEVQNLRQKNQMEDVLEEGGGFSILEVRDGSKGGSLGPHEGSWLFGSQTLESWVHHSPFNL
jgi:hypothetical protein